MFLKVPQKSQENTCARVSFFKKVAGLRPATLSEKRLWHMCFPVNVFRGQRKCQRKGALGKCGLTVNCFRRVYFGNVRGFFRRSLLGEFDFLFQNFEAMHDSLFLENICKKSWIIYQVGGTNTDFIYRVLYIRFSHFTTKSNKCIYS